MRRSCSRSFDKICGRVEKEYAMLNEILSGMPVGKVKTALLLLLPAVLCAQAQPDIGVMPMNEFRNPKKREILHIPDFGGFQTLKCDLHIHTVFSDGHVWPNVRVQEAWKEGLDVIAITDHVEYQPHRGDVVVNHNRAYELARDMAAENNILLIKGTEITRNTPPGHFNAIFIGDASGYIEDRATNARDKEAVLKAAEQNAFIFWNHPGWRATQIEGSYAWLDFVEEMRREGILHGIEVFNGFNFHRKALDWCVDKNLTVMGSSDIHNLVEHDYKLGGHVRRSMTLVFARERTVESVREALEEGRTVAWSSKFIAGREEHVRSLFDACVETGPRFHSRRTGSGASREVVTNYYEIGNKSDLYFELELKAGDGTRQVTLHPRSSQIISAHDGQESLTYEVVTAFVRGDRNLTVDIPLR
jgi:3',5'-nucleoside bisphosphate phosphatase